MVVERKKQTYSLVFKAIFYCVFAFSLIMGFFLTNAVKDVSNCNKCIEYIESWTVTDSSGKSIQTGRTYDDVRAYTENFTIASKLPEKISNDSVLCFLDRSDVIVYINGELRKSFDRQKDTGIPGGSLKEFYITVPLSSADAGAELKIIRYKTDWNPSVVPETFVTTAEGVYNYMIERYGASFAMAMILFVASLIVTISGFAVRIWKKQTVAMLYAALGILDVACWLISVSQLTPFITRVYFVDGIMGFLFCMMMPFALLIYINALQKNRYKLCYAGLFVLSLANFILWTALHFAGIQSFQTSLIYIDLVLGFVVFCVLVTLLIDVKKGHVKEYPYAAAGFLVFLIMSVTEILMLIFFEHNSNEIPMLIGLLSLLVLVVVQQIYDFRKIRHDLENEVNKKNIENEQMLIHIVKTLAGTIDAKDTYTNGHSSLVADYTKEIAKRFGYSESAQNDIYMMALLHDIGKIGVPDAVINKPGRLSADEFEIIKKHPVMGSKILENIEEKKELATGARWHHERYSGGGYPDGINGEEIPEQARIIAVADAYDAMTSSRSYRDPMPQEKVREEIEKGSGTQFDPRFASIMLEMIAEDKNYDLREKKEPSPVTGKG